MEKIYKLINQGFLYFLVAVTMLFFSIPLRAQTLPDNWIDDDDIEVFKETNETYEGSYSAKVVVNTGDQSNCDFENEIEIPLTAGDTYKLSFWANTSEHVRITGVLAWNDGNNTYPGVYVGPATSGWEEFTYEGEVPDGVDGVILRLRFYDVSGFIAGETNYVDAVTLESPLGNSLEVTNGGFETWPETAPEPTNYPDGFSAEATGLAVNLSWNDAQGEQPPHGYLILANTDTNFSPPTDGEVVEDDLELIDGEGAANVLQGEESFIFSALESSTMYYFTIYSYTNSGAEINYKTDGSPPEAAAATGNYIVINAEGFDDGLGSWTEYSVLGDQVWEQDQYGGESFARMTGYDGNSFENDDWLISPALQLDDYEYEIMSFITAMNYAGPGLQLKISTTYSGSGDPYNADWEDLQANWSTGNWEWTNSGSIDISAYNDADVYIAFTYTSTDEESATWEVDDISIMGEEIVGVDDKETKKPEVAIYPNPAANYINVDSPVKADVNIYNVLGKRIKSERIENGITRIAIDELTKGMYMAEIVPMKNQRIETLKFIVRR